MLRPARVIADTVKKTESRKLTLPKGVALPQKIRADMRHVERK